MAAYAADTLGLQLDRWQRRALNRALAYGPDGRLVHRLYVVSVGRQSGKTTLVRALIGWALTARRTPDWSMTLGLAHDRKQAQLPYRAVLADLAPVARRVGPIGRGGLALTRYLGIRSAMYGRHREYHTGSREARDAIRGESVDLGVFDEVRTQRDYDTWAALEPTTTARPDPLILAISTAGDDRSVLLRDWYERGRRIIEGAEPAAGYGMTWYAAPDDLAPDDPRAWRAANPSMAEGRLDPARIAEAYRSSPPAMFRAERLNLWTEGVDEWLPPGTWAARTRAMPPAAGAPVLGVEVTPAWSRATVTVALPTEGGAWLGTAAERTGGLAPDDLYTMLAAAAADWHPAAIAYNVAGAAAREAEAVGEQLDVPTVRLTMRDLRLASDLFRSELVAGRLAVAPDPMLAHQARVARPSGALEAGEWYLSVRESPGDIDAIRAGAWAVWALLAPDVEYPVQLFP